VTSQSGSEDFYPFADIEYRAVSGQEIVDDPEVDEGVLINPTVRPGSHQHHDQGDQQRPPRQAILGPA
jgi:hypothetical protein